MPHFFFGAVERIGKKLGVGENQRVIEQPPQTKLFFEPRPAAIEPFPGLLVDRASRLGAEPVEHRLPLAIGYV